MRIQVMRPPQMENTASVLDGLLDDDQEEDQDYHPIKNGLKRKSLDMEPSVEQLERFDFFLFCFSFSFVILFHN